MKTKWLLQIIIILALSTAAAMALNFVRGGGVALVGNWPSGISGSNGPVEPPSSEAGDPPFITIEDAATKFQSSDIIFIDSRSPEDFAYGHIRGAVSIPFDYIDEHWEAVIASLDPGRTYVVYCSGTECETSLFLGRYLSDLGFEHLFIFFGGWQEWKDNGLPTERLDTPGEGGGR